MPNLPENYGGIIPPLCTPLDANLEVDTQSLRRHINFHIEAGVHGIFMLGSTGEAIGLSNQQRATVLETAVDVSAGRVPVFGGILDTSTVRSIEHARVAQQAGVDALVLTAPFYFRPSQSEIVAHFRAVRGAVDLPLMAYDLPGAVGTKIERPTMLQMAQEGLIVGVKDSSGDQDGFRSLLVEMRRVPGFLTFTGSEFLVDAVLIMGASGAVSGLCNLDPAAYIRLYNAVRAGDLATAQHEQERLMRVFQVIYAGTHTPGRMGFSASAIGGFKTALMLRGLFDTNYVAAPMTVYEADDVERVRTILQEVGLI